MLLRDIALFHGVAVNTIIRYAKINSWSRPTRSGSLRRRYRAAAETLIGRKLEKGETVHHIDGEKGNERDDNLHVFANPSEHTLAHASLERIAFQLYKRGLIRFDPESGLYVLVED